MSQKRARSTGRLAPFLLMSALLLSGCGAGAEDSFESWRQPLSGAEISIAATVTSELGGRIGEYELEALCGPDSCRVTVLAPELIAGITAHTDGNGADICYDGLVMSAGGMTPEPCSPAGALPAVADALRDAHGESFDRDGETLWVELAPSDEYSVQVWLGEDMTPIRAELREAESGRVLTTCEITKFTIT